MAIAQSYQLHLLKQYIPHMSVVKKEITTLYECIVWVE